MIIEDQLAGKLLGRIREGLFVGVTNNGWFEFLADRRPEEVNFWRPRSQMEFRPVCTRRKPWK